MNNLYYDSHLFENAVNQSFVFNEETLKAAVRRIYEKKFNPVTEIDEEIFNETWNIFNKATDEGFGVKTYTDPDFNFYQELRYNNAVFSAFRVHRLQNDIAARLLDDKGKLKPFERFAADVAPITGHSVKRWLRTEYDTAVLRAHRAADWRQFEEVKDILPNLRWMPTTSVKPDKVHSLYWESKLTLPQDHPFWNEHRPGDRWNCKCSLEATDDPVKGKHVIDEDNQPEPDKGLDNNPGQDAQLFSDTHPYIENAHKGAKKAVDRFVEKQFEESKTKAFHEAKQKALEFFKQTYTNQQISAPNLQTGIFYDSKKGLRALVYHSVSANEIEAAMSLPGKIDQLKFVRVSPLGEGKDITNPADVANIAKKTKRGVKQYNVYKFKYRGQMYYIKLEETVHGEEKLYAFTKKP